MSTTTTRPQSEADRLKTAANQAGQTAQNVANTAGNRAQEAAHTAGNKAQEAAHTAGNKAQEFAGTVSQKAQEVAGAVGQKAQDVAGAVGQKAQDVMHTVGQKAQEFAQTAGHKAEQFAQAADEETTPAIGGTLKTAAQSVRSHLPHDGMIGHASEAVAGALERGGSYLEEKKLHDVAEDFTEVIKKHPIPSVMIAVGLGYLLGRTLRS